MDLPTLVRRACLTECTARKPGNVYPGADFNDLTHAHFVAAADVAADTLPTAGEIGVGPAVLDCVRATVRGCGTNVNLGIALLLGPLCAVPDGVPLGEGIGAVLAATTVADAAAVYEAIRLANPGGLGDAAEQDVRDGPTTTLTEAMRLAADRDAIAEQYALSFGGVEQMAGNLRLAARCRDVRWEDFTLHAYLDRLCSHADTHIARRCGMLEAERVRERAEGLLRHIRCFPLAGQAAVRALDTFLRDGSPRRNPGTTADLTCAALFWAAREGMIELPDEAALAAHAARLVRPRSRG